MGEGPGHGGGVLQSVRLCVAGRFDRVVVIGSGYHDGDQTVYMHREEAGKGTSWTCASPPPEFSVQASYL
jgi:hypothetical protein